MYLQQALSAAIKSELYPRSQIDIYVEVLQADGANYAVALNAATLALIDAGICLTEFVVACTASLSKTNIPLTDISHVEEVSGGPKLTIAALPTAEKIAFMEMSERFHIDQLETVIETAMAGCREIRNILEATVKEHLIHIGSAADWARVC